MANSSKIFQKKDLAHSRSNQKFDQNTTRNSLSPPPMVLTASPAQRKMTELESGGSKSSFQPIQNPKAKTGDSKKEETKPSNPHADEANVYAYSPSEVKELVDSLAQEQQWPAAAKRKVTIDWLVYGLKKNRYFGSHEFLKQFETEMNEVFPALTKEVIHQAVHVEKNDLSPFRKAIIDNIDKLFGPERMIKEGDKNFDRGDVVIDPITLKKETDKNPDYTTCIDFQPKLLKYHAAGKVKKIRGQERWIADSRFPLKDKNTSFFNHQGLEKAKKMGAWNPAGKEMPLSYRPKPGDVYRLKASEGGKMSHIGFILKIEQNADGTEKWTTADGGQKVLDGKKKKHAAGEVIRTYDPATNTIWAGEKRKSTEGLTQDLGEKWLHGWIDVDQILKPPK